MAYDRLNPMTKLTKKEVLDLHNGLHAVGNLSGVKFAYAVSKNIAKLKSEVVAFQEAYVPLPEFLAYEKERFALAEEYAKKIDGKAQKTIENGVERFVIENEKVFEKKLEALKKKHKKVVDAREKQIKDFEELMKEEIEIDLYQVLVSDIPEGISAKQMTSILPIVIEDLTKDTLSD